MIVWFVTSAVKIIHLFYTVVHVGHQWLLLCLCYRKPQLHSSPMSTHLTMQSRVLLPQQRTAPKRRAPPLMKSILQLQSCHPWLHPRPMGRHLSPRIKPISCMKWVAPVRAASPASLLVMNWNINNQCLITVQVTQLFSNSAPDALEKWSFCCSGSSPHLFPAVAAELFDWHLTPGGGGVTKRKAASCLLNTAWKIHEGVKLQGKKQTNKTRGLLWLSVPLFLI